jgi:hypothetical protein
MSIGGGVFYYFSTQKTPLGPSPSGGTSGKTPSPSPSGPSPSNKTPSPSPSGKTPSVTLKKKAKHVLLKRVDGKDTAINVLEIKVVTPSGTLTNSDMTAFIEPQASPANEFGPQFLIDGSKEYKASDNTYTLPHTTESKSAYMKLTLNKEQDIKEISVLNRQDCCQDRIVGTELQILASDNSVIFKAGLNIAADIFTWDDSFIYK